MQNIACSRICVCLRSNTRGAQKQFLEWKKQYQQIQSDLAEPEEQAAPEEAALEEAAPEETAPEERAPEPNGPAEEEAPRD